MKILNTTLKKVNRSTLNTYKSSSLFRKARLYNKTHKLFRATSPIAGSLRAESAVETIKELKESVKLWLSASIMIEDTHLDKEEQEQFEKFFGKAKLEKLKVFISNPNAKKNVANKLEVAIQNLSLEMPSRIDDEMESIEKEVRANFK